MNEAELHALKYPAGEFEKPSDYSESNIQSWIEDIRTFPQELRNLTQLLSIEELSWIYRPKGWNIKQVVHHCVDSHINAVCRFKLALTEDEPTIRPYMEDRWAKLPENNLNDITDSLLLLEALHRKWVRMIEFISSSELERTFKHPEYGTVFTIGETIAMYAWHCRHHLAHVHQALAAKGAFNG